MSFFVSPNTPCIFTYDPARGLPFVHNKPNEAVNVYLKCGNVDSLPLFSGLELLTINDANMKDAYTISGNRNKPSLPANENEVTLFLITKKTIQNYSLDEIHKNQMFVKRIKLTKEELEKRNWIVTIHNKEAGTLRLFIIMQQAFHR